VIVDLEPLNLKVMLGLAIAIKPKVIGELDVTLHLFEKALIELGPLPGHAGLDLVPPADDTGLHQMKFHGPGNPQNLLINTNVDRKAGHPLSMPKSAMAPICQLMR
jgi:hypothetical protein